jgi:hypothetical protein
MSNTAIVVLGIASLVNTAAVVWLASKVAWPVYTVNRREVTSRDGR